MILVTVGVGPNETMIEHDCPYWSPCNSHALLRNFPKPRNIAIRINNNLKSFARCSCKSRRLWTCDIHFSLFKSPKFQLLHLSSTGELLDMALICLKQ